MGNIRSEAHGHIKWLLLCFDGDDRWEYLAFVQALLQSLPVGTRLLICCSRPEYADFLKGELDETLSESLRFVKFGRVPKHGKCFLWVPKNANDHVNPWCRDSFFLQKAPGEAYLTLCKTHYQYDNSFLCDALSRLRIPGLSLLKEAGGRGEGLYLSGGNLLADEDFLLTGYHEFKLSWQNDLGGDISHPLPKNEADAVAALLDWANGTGPALYKKIYLVGQEAPFPRKDGFWSDSILGHIDCYLSLTATWTTDVSGRPRYVLLVARADRILLPDGVLWNKGEDLLQMLNLFLDKAAQQLADTGDFEVWRNPLPVFVHCAWDHDAERPYPVRFYMGLLNNVLLQVADGAKSVWMPRLGQAKFLTGAEAYLRSLEDSNTALWEKLGYKVRFVEANLHTFWQWRGGLRCMTLDLERG